MTQQRKKKEDVVVDKDKINVIAFDPKGKLYGLSVDSQQLFMYNFDTRKWEPLCGA